jgi:hypothetical protein
LLDVGGSGQETWFAHTSWTLRIPSSPSNIGKAQGAVLMARKVVKVYLSVEQKRILERMCKTLEMNESEALRETFMDYAKSIGLIAKKVHGKI